ncbi:MAG: amidohydrolase family protein [Candidatus Puniceispirillum sp.]|nr:amidohydrolase family protein [Candidatus Puniceispirillum sp.]MBL6774571.1 amidohydrolase family protein [Candidatus Puniceispirillum sp.]
MIIDSHAHFIPPSLIAAIEDRASEFASLSLAHDDKGSFGFSFAGGKPTRPASKMLSDTKGRIDWMDANKIDLQVIGGWLDMFGYEMPVDDGQRWSSMINDHLRQFCAENDRFMPLASLPMQDGGAAAMVLDEAHQQGFKGAMIGTQPKGKGGVLDDPTLTPFWETAHRNKSILFIHPVFDSGDDRVNDYGMNNAIGRITDTLIAISRIIYSGHVETYHDAKIVIGIGGSALPYVLGRMMRNYNLHKDTLADPSKALSMLYYDTLLHDPAALEFLLSAVGSDRIMLGSDMPFPIGDPSPLAVLDGLDTAVRTKLVSGVAGQLFGL